MMTEQELMDKYGAGLVSENDIQATYNAIEMSFDTHLEKHGVHLPALRKTSKKTNTVRYTCNALQLVILTLYAGRLVPKDYISEIVRSFVPNVKSDQQTRHLRAMGWDVLGSGKSRGKLRSATNDLKGNLYPANISIPSGLYILYQGSISPKFKTQHTRKTRVSGILTDEVWADMLNTWDYTCSLCGDKGSLEKGHLDPTKPLTANNVVPMCPDCNNHASDDWVYRVDDKGKVRPWYPSSVKFLECCSDDLIRELAANKRVRAAIGRKKS